MTERFGALSCAVAVFMAPWLVACGGADGSGSASAAPATVVIAVSEFRMRQAIGETQPSGVFVEVRYVLANGSDEDIVVSQADFTVVTPDGTTLRRSKPGTTAWGESLGGYRLTNTVLLKPGGMPRSWVSVFDVPQDAQAGSWTFRYKNEPPVEMPLPSAQ